MDDPAVVAKKKKPKAFQDDAKRVDMSILAMEYEAASPEEEQEERRKIEEEGEEEEDERTLFSEGKIQSREMKHRRCWFVVVVVAAAAASSWDVLELRPCSIWARPGVGWSRCSRGSWSG